MQTVLLPAMVQLRVGQMHPSPDPSDALTGQSWDERGAVAGDGACVHTQPGFLGLFVQIKCESCRKNTYYARSWISPSSVLFASLAEWSSFINFSTFQLR